MNAPQPPTSAAAVPQPAAPKPKRPRSNLTDFRSVVQKEIASLQSWEKVYRDDGREPHPDAVRTVQIWEDLLALLDKLEICREGVQGVFRRRGIL